MSDETTAAEELRTVTAILADYAEDWPHSSIAFHVKFGALRVVVTNPDPADIPAHAETHVFATGETRHEWSVYGNATIVAYTEAGGDRHAL